MREKQQNNRSRSRSREVERKKEVKTVGPGKYRVNSKVLSNIIMQQKRTNNRMDRTEVQRAKDKLKQLCPGVDHQVTLLSQHLSKEPEPTVSVYRPFVCKFNNKCKQRFRYEEDLNEHMKEHEVDDEELHRKAKELLDSILNKN